MPDAHAQPVVFLYVHALLGQGLAAHVRLSTGVEVLAISADDADAVADALARHPRVVIFERAPELDEDALHRLACDATLIDISDAVAPAGTLVPAQGQPPEADVIVRIVDRAYASAGSDAHC